MTNLRPTHRTLALAAATVVAVAADGLRAETVASWASPVSATWNTSSPWSTAPAFPHNNIPPGATYSAVIAATSTPYTVLFDSGYYGFLNNLTLNSPDATLYQDNASMDISGTFRIDAGTYYLARGTLANATVTGTGGRILFGPSNQEAVLQNVKFDRDLALNSVPVRVAGTLTITPGHQIQLNASPSAAARLFFSDHADQSLDGTDLHVYLNGPGTASISKDYNQLTLGPGVTVHDNTAGSISASAALINRGTILADAPGQAIQIYGVDKLRNEGAIQIAPNTTVTLFGSITNTGSIATTNATLVLATQSTLASLGTITRTGGTVQFKGFLDNTGQTLTSLAAVGAPWEVSDTNTRATITGGTINLPDGQLQLKSGGTLQFTGSTLLSPITAPDGGRVTFESPTTLSSTLTLASDGANTYLGLSNCTPLSGTGQIVFDGTSPKNFVDASNNSPTLAPGITVRTGTQGGTLRGVFTNQGTISAQTAGRTITFTPPAGSFGGGGQLTNQGTLEARDGGTIILSSQVALANLTSGTLTGGTYRVLDNSAINLTGKTISTNAATVFLSGPNSSFAALAPLSSNTGSLTFTDGRSFTTQGNFSNSGSITVGPASTLKVNGSLNGTGSIDVSPATSILLLDYTTASPIDAVRQQLLTARITSSGAPAYTRLAYVEASLLPPGRQSATAGQPVDATTLIVRTAIVGDADFDGTIDADDYALLDRAFAGSLANAHWTDGDFNYDSVLDASDYMLLDQSFAHQTGTLSPALLAQRESQFGPVYLSELLASVPEPAFTGLLMAPVALHTRRRRCR